MSTSCLPGFFQTTNGAHPCCEGFFCPQMMNCMIPCPLGAHCPRAQSVKVPPSMLHGLGSSVNETICSPFGYREHLSMKCGGADKWDVHSTAPFYRIGKNRGNVYCPSGHYCEDTIHSPKICEEKHYCRVGSIKPKGCPFMTTCKQGSSLPKDYFGLVFDSCMFLILALTWQASKYYNRLLRRLTARERIRIHWGWNMSCDIVRDSGRSPTTTSTTAVAHQPLQISLLPKLVALRSLSRSFTGRLPAIRSRSQSHRDTSDVSPAVWASLSREIQMDSSPTEDDSPASETPLLPITESQSIQQEPLNYITIDFYALCLKVRSCGRVVVSGSSGKFQAARLTVVMGPSGCGKTSLLSYLACEGAHIMTSGTILINGGESTLKRYQSVTGFVPQDDIVHPKLTVEENLLFSAKFRLPRHLLRQDRLFVVDRAIQLLGLAEVRNQLVGNEENRGVSGGQRKRVNIGLELVADPWVLFLDEPTSGLDSTSCRHVLSSLSKIAHMGVTCAAVVHQPSNRVMKMFDDVLLMDQQARTVYYGPQSLLKSYFISLGFQFPLDENPADVYLDIITKPKVPPISPDRSLVEIWESSEHHSNYLTLPELDRNLSSEMQSLVTREASAVDTHLDGFGLFSRIKNTVWMLLFLLVSPLTYSLDSIYKSLCSLSVSIKRSVGYTQLPSEPEDLIRMTPGFLTQFWLCFYRCILERSRSALRIFLEYTLFAISGMILGLLSEARTTGRLTTFIADMNYNIVACALMTTVSALRTFNQNQLVFFRESRAGLDRLAYYCSTALFGDVGSILKGLVYLSLYYSYAQPRAKFSNMFLVTSAIVYACSGFGYLFSKIFKPSAAQLATAVFVLSNALLAGRNSSLLIDFIKKFLYHRWGLEAFTIVEAEQLFGVWSLERCGTLYAMNYDIHNFQFAILALIFIGLTTRFLTFVVIMVGTRDKSS
eukprot:g3322.t1